MKLTRMTHQQIFKQHHRQKHIQGRYQLQYIVYMDQLYIILEDNVKHYH